MDHLSTIGFKEFICYFVFILIFIFIGPSEPLNLAVKVDASNPRKLLLSWDQPSVFNTMQSYEIIQSIDGGLWEMLVVGGSTNTWNVTANSPGSQYRFRIRARDLNGRGPFTGAKSVISIDGKLLRISS